jgi:hypothetical protein
MPSGTPPDGPELRRELAESLALVDEDWANQVEHPLAEVNEYPTPFLQCYKIVGIEYSLPQKPRLLYVAYAPRRPAHVLTANPEEFSRLAQDDGVEINSDELASKYATVFLDVTRSMTSLFYLVESIEDVEFRPKLTDEEDRERVSFIQHFRSILSAPAVESTDGGYDVTLYAVRDQAVEQHCVRVERDGVVTETVETLVDGLPLIYGT